MIDFKSFSLLFQGMSTFGWVSPFIFVHIDTYSRALLV